MQKKTYNTGMVDRILKLHRYDNTNPVSGDRVYVEPKRDNDKPGTPNALEELRERIAPTGPEIAGKTSQARHNESERRKLTIFPALDQNEPNVVPLRIILGRKKPF